jgi:GNAT superfamily N-acetyltransferase
LLLTHEQYKDNLLQIIGLFAKCFGRQGELDFFKWRYLNNPVKEILVNVELDANVIIANYSASPCMMSIGGHKYKTAMSMTTMTHPAYSGKGIFTLLAEQLYQYMQEQQYVIIWGFPNNNSHRTFASKLKWIDIYEIPTMQLRDIPRKNDEILLPTDNNFDLNYTQAQNLGNLIHVVKDQTYLKWRYANNPANQYTNFVITDGDVVNSFCVLKAYGKQIDVVDFQAKDIIDGQILLRQIIKFSVESKAESIGCWAPRHHFIHGLFEKNGFTNKEPITYCGVRQLKSLIGDSVISSNYSEWYLQMGDSDVY